MAVLLLKLPHVSANISAKATSSTCTSSTGAAHQYNPTDTTRLESWLARIPRTTLLHMPVSSPPLALLVSFTRCKTMETPLKSSAYWNLGP